MSRWLVGAVFVLLGVGGGAMTVLAALGVVPAADADFGAPRWIVALLGTVLVAMGLYGGLAGRLSDPWRDRLGGAFALLFFTAASIFLTWAALTGAEGRGGLAVAGVPIPLPAAVDRALNRGFVLFCAVLMDGITLVSWWVMGRHAWRSLAGARGAS